MKLAVLHKNINPFGLRHGSYNETVSMVTLTAETTTGRGNGQGRGNGCGGGGVGNGNGNTNGNSGGVILQQIDPEEQKYKYYFQEQERQDELGLNWDSFKYRNYDYAIGRFMSIDPLAEKYPYNATYAFQENKMGLGRELEGLELDEFYDGVTQFINGIIGAKEVYDNGMLDPNTSMAQQEYETSNPEAQHISTIGEASQNVQQGAENMTKGAIKGSADTVTEVSDNAIIAMEAVTVSYPPAGEVTVPAIGVLEGVSIVSTGISASVDVSDGNMNAAMDKVEGLAINQAFKSMGNKVGNTVTKDFKPTETIEKKVTQNTINIITDWFSRTFEEIFDNDTFQW